MCCSLEVNVSDLVSTEHLRSRPELVAANKVVARRRVSFSLLLLVRFLYGTMNARTS